MGILLNSYGTDELATEISEFIQSKINHLSNEDFKTVLGDVISDLEAQLAALDDDLESEFKNALEE
ncbi:hypothetical protein AB670_02782 [Chryseobacterium sp. MOF25P]|uniref:hypothetical protein n=1 Tax=unclassified Chryseobacterium TaxID=2593645 RepID=UPI0008048F3F|nr:MULTISPECIES: hypothetical protein [unclassified Chryseobacterium]OBW40831.1 hypothetical protein AB670_02782 [Chryseobacterium sp. MOF25P]OBW45295.1 hypothetical protein AB671_02592 [Chryseobacterium sp. BGARF1]